MAHSLDHSAPVPISRAPSRDPDNIQALWGALSRDMRQNEPIYPAEASQPALDMSGSYIGFVEGTRLVTGKGRIAVEFLRPGDSVWTLDRGMQTLRWVGRRKILLTDDNTEDRPIIVQPDALRMGSPTQPTHVAPDHLLLVDDWRAQLYFNATSVLIEAQMLVDGTWLMRDEACREVTYIYLDFDEIEVVEASTQSLQGSAVSVQPDAHGNYADFLAASQLSRPVISNLDASVLSGVPRRARRTGAA